MLDKDLLCDEVLIALRRIMRAIDLHSKRLTQQHGVTGPQVLVLRTLVSRPEQSVGELAREVSLSQATVTDILDRLERRGLIRRTRSTRDKRRVIVEATDEAVTLLRQAPPLLQESFTSRFKQLQEWEQTLILSSVQRIADMMNAADLDVAPVLSSGPLTGSEPNGGEWG